MKKKKINYVDNKELYNLLVEYKEQIQEAENQGESKPAVSKELSLGIWEISKQMAKRGNFSSYSYKDEMILDGIENCIRYCHNFDPEKYKNAYGYLSKIIWQAFVRRIKKEHKQAYIKAKTMENSLLFDIHVEQSSENHLSFNGDNIYINDNALNYDPSLKKKKEEIVDETDEKIEDEEDV